MKQLTKVIWIGFILVLITGSMVALPAHANPGVLYVKPDGATNGACSAWETACALSYALTTASSGDELWLAQGVYTPTTRLVAADPRSATFTLKHGVALYGGFAGGEVARTARAPQIHLTVLSGDLDGNDSADASGVVTATAAITGTNAYHVVSNSGRNTVTLDGLVITAGYADGETLTDKYGGGLYNREGQLTLRDVIFNGNYAAWFGGGMYDYGGTAKLTDVMFQSNTANNGGGMYNTTNTINLHNVVFMSNTAYGGGGMYSYISAEQLTDVHFSANHADLGGGMYNNYTHPALDESVFTANTALNGGAMYNDRSSPTLINAIFQSNEADTGGGMDNRAGSAPTLHNALFSANVAGRGGALYNDASRPVLINATLSDNTAERGSAVYNRAQSLPTLVNGILWGNVVIEPDTILLGRDPITNEDAASKATVSYSNVQLPSGVYSGDGNINADPRFVRPGQVTESIVIAGDYHLRRDSPAIDAGNNTSVTVAIDLGNGFRRVDIPEIADTGLGMPPIVDMGAYEVGYSIYLPLVARGMP